MPLLGINAKIVPTTKAARKKALNKVRMRDEGVYMVGLCVVSVRSIYRAVACFASLACIAVRFCRINAVD